VLCSLEPCKFVEKRRLDVRFLKAISQLRCSRRIRSLFASFKNAAVQCGNP
ncbi:hypothetical protein pipiens_000532, partial [Culex pipiens pipiens]